MSKEINEKTFELNITTELLNISKSWVWYMQDSPIRHTLPPSIWEIFLNNSIFFAEGLTQKQESDTASGGYDVSINYKLSSGINGRLLFLQYKAGEHSNYCMNIESQFHRTKSNDTDHVLFHFNDAAYKTQHSTLRNLANKSNINSNSVVYVFPRITKKNELINNIGDLLSKTSFVPVLDIDKQGLEQVHPVQILDGVSHKYRTSYDGRNSEVNYYYYYYYYDFTIISKIIAELICIQIYRALKLQIKTLLPFIYEVTRHIEDAVAYSLTGNFNKEIIMTEVKNYLKVVEKNINFYDVPKAPQNYSTEIPIDGLLLKFDKNIGLDSIQYQVF